MKKSIQFITVAILLASFSSPVFAQWTQRQSLSGAARTFAAGFTINNAIYVIGGFDGSSLVFNDVWAYDVLTDTWTQKGNFPGGNRASTTAFSIGNKGYMGTGSDGNNYLHDFWEYEPTADIWTQKADFPGFEREEAVGFGIGSKGYLGTGQVFVVTPNSSFTTTFNDFYEYDPTTDSWSQKDSLPGPSRAYAVGTVIGNKGYLGLGGNNDQTISYTDFYEYDPAIDSWTPKASMGGSGRAYAGIVASGNTIYVIGGINFPSFSGIASCRVYDRITDTWSNGPNFTPGVIIAPVVQNANGRIFAGTGYYNGFVPRSDWWEFTSLPNAIENAEAEQFTVFPNPFSNQVYLHLNNNVGKNHIEIFNAEGQLVYSALQESIDSETRKIDTKKLTKGIYMIRVVNGSGKLIAAKKLVKI